ncbi:MAG: 3-deoxy-7-phosphoheptulonate synthase, partial [Betaproteobacteria bacterium]|nr:3-deoxy-7-phosphoheptulonate synthase [Betaproteobacteria bacterium]
MTTPVTDDLRIREILELAPPSHLLSEFPVTEAVARTTASTRGAVHRILHGMDDRMVVVIGPCSIHDPQAAYEYARRLAEQRRCFAGELEIIMRVYFEKPR